MKRTYKYLIIFLSYIVFLLVTFFIKGSGYSDWIFLTTTFVVFIFAIFLAFSISNRRERLLSLRESDGVIIALYKYSEVFNEPYSKKLLNLIDEYLILQIDYSLSDFKETQGACMNIYEFIATTDTKSDKEEDAKMAMMDDLENMLKLRKKIEFSLTDEMQPYEWVTIAALALLTILSLVYINDGSLVSLVILPVLETVIVVIFITIFDLDSLRWQERNWIWDPLSSLFIALDLDPYFPDVLITKNRVSKSFLNKFDIYRLGHYKSPYPIFSDKTIEIINRNQLT